MPRHRFFSVYDSEWIRIMFQLQIPQVWRHTAAADWLRRCVRGQRHPLYLRENLARQFLHGQGIEIGALHLPLRVPAHLKVRYLDRFDNRGLLEHYPDLKTRKLVSVDIVDDAETLKSIPSASLNFVIANHFLEHTQNPLRVLERFLQVLAPGGMLFLTVPDRTGTFDRERPLTPFSHLLRDYREGPQWSYRDHVEEFVRLAQHWPEEGVADQIENIITSDYSIHFHVWTHESLMESLLESRRVLKLPFSFRAMVKNDALSESICVLSKTES